MKFTLIVIGVIIFGVALRATHKKWPRKLGVLCYIFATGLAFYFAFDSLTAGIIAASGWFLFPWIELLCSVRKTRLPLENKLCKECLPGDNYFPEASNIKRQFLEKGYQHITDCGWKWAKSHEHYSFFWHSEQKHLVAICHRIQSCVTFCYLNITSTDENGTIWRSSNFPFSASLPHSPKTRFNHVTQGKISCPEHVLYSHELFLYNAGVGPEHLSTENMEQVETLFEQEMRSLIDHNLKSGMIRLTGDGHFRYSFKGLVYLWWQILKDMFRMC